MLNANSVRIEIQCLIMAFMTKKQQTLEAAKKLHEIGYRILYISVHSSDYGFVYAPEKASN